MHVQELLSWLFNSAGVRSAGVCSYQVVSAGVVHHPALSHHSGAPPLGVLDGLDHAHEGDVTAGGGTAEHSHTNTR